MSFKNNLIGILDPNEKRAKSLQSILKAYPCFIFQNKDQFLDLKKTIGILILNSEIENLSFVIQQAKEKGILKSLFVCTKNQEELICQALNAGVDDYLFLPVRQHELLSRIHVFLRQMNKEDLPYLKHNDFSFKRYPNRLFYKNEIMALAAKEFELADLLFHHLDQPLSRAHIAQSVWQMDGNDMLRTIDTHISRLRTKLNLRPKNGYLLEHIYGFGYCLRPVIREKNDE